MDFASRLSLAVLALVLLCSSSICYGYGHVSTVSARVYSMTCSGTTLSGSSPGSVLSQCVSRRAASADTYINCAVRQADTWTYTFVSEAITATGGTWSYSASKKTTYVNINGSTCTPPVAVTTNYGTASDGSIGPPVLGCDSTASSIGSGATLACECPLGYKAGSITGQCVPYQCGAAGAYTAVQTPDFEVSTVGTQCVGGCEVNPNTFKTSSDGKIWATWPFRTTGKACGGSSLSSSDSVASGTTSKGDAPVTCGASLCPGSVNGVAVCVACGKTSTATDTTSTTSTDSSGTTTSGTTTKQTSCDGTNCTTTTTTTNSSGTVTGTTSETKSQDSFCAQNPTVSICKSSAFGGGCSGSSGAFTCNGDAVQCALATEVYKRNCEWAAVDSTLQAKGTTAMNGELQPSDHPANSSSSQAVNFSSVIDQTDRIGGGCPVDYSFSVMGQPYVIPFSSHCDKFQMIGRALVAVCMLAAVMIVFRG